MVKAYYAVRDKSENTKKELTFYNLSKLIIIHRVNVRRLIVISSFRNYVNVTKMNYQNLTKTVK